DDGEARVEGKVNIDQECCVHCGWCAAVCPVNAIEVEKPFEGEWKWDGDTCQGCRTCVDTCPVSALFTPGREVGEIVDNIAHRPDVCIYCGACAVSCPVGAIDVVKTAVVPHIDKYSAIEKKILNVSPPTPLLTSVLKTDEDACLGCNNCVIVCPVNALSSPELASAHLYEVDSKPLLDVVNGRIKVVEQDMCGSCATCAMICPVNAIWLEKREEPVEIIRIDKSEKEQVQKEVL
ncbi:MAG: 4Fe-4S dicluster domain-containing protein, partial [Methermicoccaceae archaeon]